MDAMLMNKAKDLATEFATKATTLEELNGLMHSLMKTALERMLNTELEVHLGRRSTEATAALVAAERDSVGDVECQPPKTRNRKNGMSSKTVQGSVGKLPLDVPRDRDGTFEPHLIGKYQRRLPGFDEKILALYAKGLTTRDIQDLVRELYGVEVSPTLISEITADLDAEVKLWQTRRLDAVWPIVFLDGIVVHLRGESGRVSEHTMYVAIRVSKSSAY